MPRMTGKLVMVIEKPQNAGTAKIYCAKPRSRASTPSRLSLCDWQRESANYCSIRAQ